MKPNVPTKQAQHKPQETLAGATVPLPNDNGNDNGQPKKKMQQHRRVGEKLKLIEFQDSDDEEEEDVEGEEEEDVEGEEDADEDSIDDEDDDDDDDDDDTSEDSIDDDEHGGPADNGNSNDDWALMKAMGLPASFTTRQVGGVLCL